MKLVNFFKKIINTLENSKVPFNYFIASFLFIIFLRCFLEIFSSHAGFKLLQFYHYGLFYISLALSLVLVFKLITKSEIEKIFRLILPAFMIIFLPPIIDLIVCRGRGCIMTYLLPAPGHDNLFIRLLTLGGEYSAIGGITPGIKIELFIIILVSYFYFYSKNKRKIRSIIFSVAVYLIIFAHLIAPIIYKNFIMIFGRNYYYSDFLISNFYIFIIFFVGLSLFYLYNKKYFLAIVRDLRILRLLHFWLMLFLGISIGFFYTEIIIAEFDLSSFIPFPLITILIIIFLAWLYSVITNNIEDYEIDRINNSIRPLTTKTIPLDFYKKLAKVVLIFILASSLAIGFEAFFIILLFVGNYFLYSMPPFRFKRIPIISKLVISLNSLLLVVLGYILGYIYQDNLNIPGIIRDFPIILIIFFLVFFTLAINFIDIKDYKGDKKVGIKTLPVILGLKNSKIVIGIFFLAAYFLVYFLFDFLTYFLYLFIALGIVQYLLINRKNYSEKPIFIVYLITLLAVIFLNA